MLAIWKKNAEGQRRTNNKISKISLKVKERARSQLEELRVTSINLDGCCSTATFDSAFAGNKILSENKKLR